MMIDFIDEGTDERILKSLVGDENIDQEMLEKAIRDRSKLVPKVITDKNGHRRTVYVKSGAAPAAQPKATPKVEEAKPKTDKRPVASGEWMSGALAASKLRNLKEGSTIEVRYNGGNPQKYELKGDYVTDRTGNKVYSLAWENERNGGMLNQKDVHMFCDPPHEVRITSSKSSTTSPKAESKAVPKTEANTKAENSKETKDTGKTSGESKEMPKKIFAMDMRELEQLLDAHGLKLDAADKRRPYKRITVYKGKDVYTASIEKYSDGTLEVRNFRKRG